MKITIAGHGAIGHYIEGVFQNLHDIDIYDPALGHANAATLRDTDFVIVCVPTPTAEDGSCDTSIVEEFSDQATKQGIPGTYIKYFQKKFMDEFQKTDSYLNPFLQHVFQGYYSSEAAFPYMNPGFNQELEFIEGTLYDVPDISSYVKSP